MKITSNLLSGVKALAERLEKKHTYREELVIVDNDFKIGPKMLNTNRLSKDELHARYEDNYVRRRTGQPLNTEGMEPVEIEAIEREIRRRFIRDGLEYIREKHGSNPR